MLRGMFCSVNSIRTVSSPYRGQPLKKQMQDLYIFDLIIHRTCISTDHFFAVKEWCFYFPLFFSIWWAPAISNIYLTSISLGRCFLPRPVSGVLISRTKVVTRNLCVCSIFLGLNYEMPQEYFCKVGSEQFF